MYRTYIYIIYIGMCVYMYDLTFFAFFCILIGVKITSVGMEFCWSKNTEGKLSLLASSS